LPSPIIQAQPPLAFVPPAFNPLVYQTACALLPAWMNWRTQIAEVQVQHPERLVELYQQFQAGKVRFMLAFRHPSVNDPFSLLYLLSRRIPQAAKQQGIALKSPVHAHFIYDRGIPLWAGSLVGWFIPQMGGTPIRRGKVDLPGLRSIRQLFLDGDFPMAAAPEGATNGHAEIVSPLEPGIAQFGFWCAEDLHKAKRPEQVLIVPIGIRYHYVSPPWPAIEQLLDQLEADCGLPRATEASLPPVQFAGQVELEPGQLLQYRRLLRLGAYLLTQMETFYSRFYHQPLIPQTADQSFDTVGFHDQLAARLEVLLNSALSVAEQYFGLTPKGSVTDRCRRIEQAGWDWIFREDLEDMSHLPPTERGLADRIAEEADLRLWHMRLVETFVSVTGHYILEKPSVDRLAETLLLVWDTVTRLKGGNPTQRPKLGRQRVELTIDQPLSVSDRYADYQTNRRQAVTTLTQDLQAALEAMIE
jgi:1-acyl-sn-glycerol-3-phosphate acyltransferase